MSQIIWINIQLSMFGVVSLDHLARIPPFDLWGGGWWTLRKLSQTIKKGRKLLVSLPFFCFYELNILHMSIHIRKQGSTLDMPITAIKNGKLFGHWIRHCFRPKCFYL
jgi:hypothetical protein